MKRRDNLFRPDRRILSPEDAAREAENPTERSPIAPRQRVPGNPLHDYVTREELIKGCSNAAIAVGDKMYEQMSEETGQYLREMEMDLRGVIADEVRLAFERRTLRYRLRFLWYKWFPGKPALVMSGNLAPTPPETIQFSERQSADAFDVVEGIKEAYTGERDGNAEMRGVRDASRGDLPERPSGDGPREDAHTEAETESSDLREKPDDRGTDAEAEGTPDISPPPVREVPETLHPDGA